MSATVESFAQRLGALFGGGVRVATEADAVAGVAAGVVVEPTDEVQVAAVLALADRDGLKVVPRGAGTQLGLGFPPAAADIILSTAQLRSLIEYNPHDLTVTVQAGMALFKLQHLIGTSGQFLALDPDVSVPATIGGIIATNASGSLRLRYGGVRDQIIGVRVVTADGTMAKGGGKVVKNVAGYDLPKLYTGSLGTLGVIVAATFRVYPLPAALLTVVVDGVAPARLCDLARDVLSAPLEPAALCLSGATREPSSVALVVRFFSVAEAVAEQSARVVELARAIGAHGRAMPEDEHQTFWLAATQDLMPNPHRAEGLLVKASVLPTCVAPWLQALERVTAEHGIAARYAAHAGHGIIFARLTGSIDALAAAVEPLRAAASSAPAQGSLVVWDAPSALTRRVDVWGPSPALALMRRLKVAFDPNTTLNPGRFIGRI
jgi:glycolate oxidase FAD binding subunit